jgi:hypothetical protein
LNQRPHPERKSPKYQRTLPHREPSLAGHARFSSLVAATGRGGLIRVLHPGLFAHRITPATCANEVPLETVANRSEPMACGPNVDQARDAQRTGRLGSGALVGGSRTGPTRAPSLRPTRRPSLLSPRAHLDRSATSAGRITFDAPLLEGHVSAHHGPSARTEGFEAASTLLGWRSWAGRRCDMRFVSACRGRWCPSMSQIPDAVRIQRGSAHATTMRWGLAAADLLGWMDSGSDPIVRATDLLAVAGGKR